jgi:hypothetical protein
MGDHYIPRYYLNGFCNDGELWAYDRLHRKKYRSKPKSIANENGFYTPEVELRLNREIEYPAMGAIDKVRELRPIDLEDRRVLTRYIEVMWRRVPTGRDRLASHLPAVAESVGSEMIEAMRWHASQNPEDADRALSKIDQINDIIKRYAESPPLDLWANLVLSEGTGMIGTGIDSMNWRFLVSENHQFVTSDNPVFFFDHEGIGNAKSELMIPFSPNVALWANRKPEIQTTYIKAPPIWVKEANRRIASSAKRLLVAGRDEPWILPFFLKEQYSLNRLVLN